MLTVKQEEKLLQKKQRLKKMLSEIDITSEVIDSIEDLEIKHLFAELLEESVYEKARHDFHLFVRLMAPVLLPDGYRDGVHISLICKKLMDLESGKIKRLMVFLPPGSMKSILCSKLFPAWCFGRNPTWNVISIGHGTQFAEDNFGRPTRDLINSTEYKKIFPATSVKSDVKKAGRWDTDQGGKYFCTGAGSAITGRRAHVAILDDVLTEHTAYSDTERESINRWYGSGLRTRLLPEGRELIVNTRWHHQDISGYLLEEAAKNKKTTQWEVVSVPAILNEEAAKELQLDLGGSFWPEFWPLDRLLELKNDPSMTTAKWSALYMQNPTPEEGNFIKLEWCKLWTNEEARKYGKQATEPPDITYLIVSLDTAFSEKEDAAYSAYTVWGVFYRYSELTSGKKVRIPSLILLDAAKGRWAFPELCRKVQSLYDSHKPDGILIEKRASGQSLIQEMRRRSLPIIEFNPDKDKLSRVHACTPFFENSRIWFPDTDYSFVLINELIKFPNIASKDLVDTVSQAVLWMRDTWHINSVESASDGDDDDNIISGRPSKTYWQTLLGR